MAFHKLSLSPQVWQVIQPGWMLKAHTNISTHTLCAVSLCPHPANSQNTPLQ